MDTQVKNNNKKMRTVLIGLMIISGFSIFSCRASKKINKAIAPKNEIINSEKKNIDDSIRLVNTTFNDLKSHTIDFNTFSGKIKVESSGSNGKNPDLTAVVKIKKDSAIWISLSATFLNVEVFRILITKDSVFLLDKQQKEAKLKSLDYLQEVTQIPFDYKTLQDLLIGNPVFMSDSIISFKKNENITLLATVDDYFKNLITLSSENSLILHSKMDDVDVTRSRTAQISYFDYQNVNGIFFSSSREIDVSEKSKLNVKLNYKQFEFDKEVSITFNIPKNYKRK